MFDFSLFEQIPAEVREVVYGYVLKSERPIIPHLCDASFARKSAKFHDDNATSHDSVFQLTSLTRASRKLRKESFPIFYSANSFAVGADTTTYFAWLDSVGRLNRVLRVNLVIPNYSEEYSARILWMVSQFDEEAESHNQARHTLDEIQSLTIPRLRQHPRYLAGGLRDLNLAILLRMLSTSSAPDTKKRLVLPVSQASVFETDSSLRWLSTLARGLDVELRFVEQPNSATRHDRRVHLEWNRKYQGKDIVTVAAGPEPESRADVMTRAKELFPDIENMYRPRGSSYYRRPCHGGSIVWYNMPTMGGGRI